MQIQPPTTIEEAIRLLLHYVGIIKITKNNVKKVYIRSKQLQVIMQGAGMWEGRMPYWKELEDNIGYVADVTTTHSDKKWEKILLDELSNLATQWCTLEEEHLAKAETDEVEEVGSKEPTINEENMEAGKKLEEITNPSESEEAKYPY